MSKFTPPKIPGLQQLTAPPRNESCDAIYVQIQIFFLEKNATIKSTKFSEKKNSSVQ